MNQFCALFIVFAAGCGGRTELQAPDAPPDEPPCTKLDIGIFGNPGAYGTLDFDQWLVTSGANVQRIQTTADEPLTEATLQAFDVVVLDWLTRDYTASEATIFEHWVVNGGGVVSMSGYNHVTTDNWHANSLLAPLEVAYSGELISGPVTNLALHPIMDGIKSVVFEGGYAISDLGGDASTRTPIAFLPGADDKVNAGYAIQMGAGRGFVWGDEWIEFTSKEFPPKLWVQVFEWISPERTCGLVPVK